MNAKQRLNFLMSQTHLQWSECRNHIIDNDERCIVVQLKLVLHVKGEDRKVFTTLIVGYRAGSNMTFELSFETWVLRWLSFQKVKHLWEFKLSASKVGSIKNISLWHMYRTETENPDQSNVWTFIHLMTYKITSFNENMFYGPRQSFYNILLIFSTGCWMQE